MKTKVKRYNFAFDQKTDDLLRKIKELTDIGLTTIVQRAIEDYAVKKGVK